MVLSNGILALGYKTQWEIAYGLWTRQPDHFSSQGGRRKRLLTNGEASFPLPAFELLAVGTSCTVHPLQ